jgi:hypothetical protein
MRVNGCAFSRFCSAPAGESGYDIKMAQIDHVMVLGEHLRNSYQEPASSILCKTRYPPQDRQKKMKFNFSYTGR